MKKQRCYLPNLNYLLKQNRQYLLHKRKLTESKSEYKSERINTQHTRVNDKARLLSSPNESYQNIPLKLSRHFQPPPFQKRKHQQQFQQNLRLSKAIQSINSTLIDCRKRNEDNSSNIKERISRYVADGGKILYKYKRSLLGIEREKKSKQYLTQREKDKYQHTKQKLTLMLEQSQQLNSRAKTTPIETNVIFHNNDNSLTITSPLRLKPAVILGKSLTQNILNYDQLASYQARHQPISKQSRSFMMKQKLNVKMVLKSKQAKKSLSDIQTIEIEPI